MTNQTEIVAALRTLGVTSQKLIHRIREDLERGLVEAARARLWFVDELVATDGDAPPVKVDRDCRDHSEEEDPWMCSCTAKLIAHLEAKLDALRWTHDKPTKPGLYLLANAPNTNPTLVSVRQATDGELVLVDEPDGCDSLDQLDDLHECHLWCGPVPVPNAIPSSDGTSTV